MASEKQPFKIKRPGALRAQMRPGETMTQTAQRLAREGTPLQKREANLYLNVFKPANAKRKKKRGGNLAQRLRG